MSLQLSLYFSSDEMGWLGSQLSKMVGEHFRKAFYLAFSMVPRKIQKVKLSDHPFKVAEDVSFRGDFDSHDLARFYLVTEYLKMHKDQEAVEKLFETASVPELISLNKTMYWFDGQNKNFRCGEGLRSSVQSVFESVSHLNPYPYYELEESAWNQMVLKSLFIESPIYKIYKLENRQNQNLQEMVVDYIRERTIASRDVSVEIWRLVGELTDPLFEKNFAKMKNSDNPLHHMALALYFQNHKPENLTQDLKEMLVLCPNWDTLGQKLESFNKGN